MSDHSNKGSTADQAKQAAQQAKESASQTAEKAQDMAEPYVNKAQQMATDQANQRKNQVASAMSSVSDALRQTGDHLRQQNQGMYAGFADQAANQVDSLASYLQNQNINSMIDEVERFGRDQPYLLVGGAFALGMFGARFLKASRPQDSRSNRPNSNWSTGTSYGSPAYGTGTPPTYSTGAGYGTGTSVGTPYDETPVTDTPYDDRPYDTTRYGVDDVTRGEPGYTSPTDAESRGDSDATR